MSIKKVITIFFIVFNISISLNRFQNALLKKRPVVFVSFPLFRLRGSAHPTRKEAEQTLRKKVQKNRYLPERSSTLSIGSFC